MIQPNSGFPKSAFPTWKAYLDYTNRWLNKRPTNFSQLILHGESGANPYCASWSGEGGWRQVSDWQCPLMETYWSHVLKSSFFSFLLGKVALVKWSGFDSRTSLQDRCIIDVANLVVHPTNYINCKGFDTSQVVENFNQGLRDGVVVLDSTHWTPYQPTNNHKMTR